MKIPATLASVSLLLSGLTVEAAILTGFDANVLSANDDGSTGQVSIGFAQPINFFGTSYSALYVNNNGNVTFDTPLATFTPFGLSSTSTKIIAPFFADVDTRGAGSGLTRYGGGTVAGRSAFGVTWRDVGYFPSQGDKLNSFQLVLIDRSDVAPGDFDIQFNYEKIEWESGGASGGSGGLGGTSAAAGYSNGLGGAANVSFEVPGSRVNGAFLDINPGGLRQTSNTSTPGLYAFQVRNGIVQLEPIPEPSTALIGALLTLPVLCRRRRAISQN